MRILIAGCGIAGLTLAHWLARSGFEPTVVERAAGPRPGGNGVDIRDEAAAVVEEMGLSQGIQAAATDIVGMKFVDADDRCTARIDIRQPGSTEILRGDLVALLRGVADVEYVFGDSIRDLDQDDTGVTVAFEHAATRRFDLVVGADGLHSTVRALAFGPESRFVRYRGLYFAFAEADASLSEDRWVTMYNRPGRLVGIYRSGSHAKAQFAFRSPLLADDRRQHRRIVSDVFGGDRSWHTAELLAGALADPDFYLDSVSQVRMPTWHAGRVVLVGDAAYCASPASGAGAELAVVGARRLAGALAAADGDHRIAFPRYQDGLRALVRAKQRIGVNVRVMVPRTDLGRRVRDAVARSRFHDAPATVHK